MGAAVTAACTAAAAVAATWLLLGIAAGSAAAAAVAANAADVAAPAAASAAIAASSVTMAAGTAAVDVPCKYCASRDHCHCSHFNWLLLVPMSLDCRRDLHRATPASRSPLSVYPPPVRARKVWRDERQFWRDASCNSLIFTPKHVNFNGLLEPNDRLQ